MASKDTDNTEFVMVSDGAQTEPETKIVFDTFGDTFTGTYLGMRSITNDQGSYQQARFQTDDGIFFTNANYSLKEGLKSVRTGTITRVTFVNDLDTGQASPMRIFTIEVSRKRTVSHST